MKAQMIIKAGFFHPVMVNSFTRETSSRLAPPSTMDFGISRILPHIRLCRQEVGSLISVSSFFRVAPDRISRRELFGDRYYVLGNLR